MSNEENMDALTAAMRHMARELLRTSANVTPEALAAMGLAPHDRRRDAAPGNDDAAPDGKKR